MIGDTAEVDIAGGLNAGMRTIWMGRERYWQIEVYAPELVAYDIGEAGLRGGEVAGPCGVTTDSLLSTSTWSHSGP